MTGFGVTGHGGRAGRRRPHRQRPHQWRPHRQRPRWRRPRLGHPQRGSAALEFLAVFAGCLVPLLCVILTMEVAQRAMLGTSSAAREVGRVYATAGSVAEARDRASVVAEEILANYGLDDAGRYGVRVRTSCHAGACASRLEPGTDVEVTVTYRLPVAGRLQGPLPVDLPVQSVHRTRVAGLAPGAP